MLVFVLQSSNAAQANATKANLAYIAPEWSVQFVHDHSADILNDRLRDYALPFFITLQAGDLLHRSFLTELNERLTTLPEGSAGLIYERGNHASNGLPDAPLLWRTSAVRSTGSPLFPGSDRLPFDTYRLHDKMFQLKAAFTWVTVSSSWWQPQAAHIPKWQRKQDEWELVRPILEAGSFPTRLSSRTFPSPQISIALCTFNNADYMLWSIRSVLAQTIDDWELIIIDDASTDQTQQKLATLPQDPRIRTYTNPVNLGKSHCLNLALSVCHAPWLVELDADDWLPPEGIRTLLDSAKLAVPVTSLVYGDYYEWTERARKGLIFGGIRKAPAAIEVKSLLQRALPVAPRCYRVSALHKIGGWFVGGPYEGRLYEDFEIIVRLAQSSAFHYVAAPLYHRRIRNSSITHQHSEKYDSWKRWMELGAAIQGDGGDAPGSTGS